MNEAATLPLWKRLRDWVSGKPQSLREVTCFDREVVSRAGRIWQWVQPALQSSGRQHAADWAPQQRHLILGYIAAASAEIADASPGSPPANLISIVAARVALQGQMLEHDIFVEYCRLEDSRDADYVAGLGLFEGEHGERLKGLPPNGLADALLARRTGYSIA